MKFSYTCLSSFSLCSMTSSILKEPGSMSGRTLLPSSLMNPNFSRRRARSLFNSVHELFLLLGDSLWASPVSDTFFLTPSIHPKHKASSTTSKYNNISGVGVILTKSQQDFSVLPWFCSQILKSSRSCWNDILNFHSCNPSSSFLMRISKHGLSLEGHVLNELLFVRNDTIKKLICVAIKFPGNSELINQHSKARRPRGIG